MKRTFTLLTAVVFSLTLAAQPTQTSSRSNATQSRLTVSTISNSPVKIVIDGRTYNERQNRDNDIVIRDIRPGYHNVKIYQQHYNGYGGRRSKISSAYLVYSGNVYMKPRYHVDITINRFGKAFIDEAAMSGGHYEDDNDGDHDWNNHNNYMQPMPAVTFGQFKQTVINGTYEDTKLSIAKRTIDENYFTAAQVKEVVELFTYESNRLELAKYAYKKAVDKSNYFLVSNALTYSSSKEELARFLQTTR